MSKLVLKSRKDSGEICNKRQCKSPCGYLNTLCVYLCMSLDRQPPPTDLTCHSKKILTIHFTVLPFQSSSFPTVLSGATKLL